MVSAIALSGADIGWRERQTMLRVLRSGRLALGPRAAEFERLFADYVGTSHAVAVASGTAALHLLVRALGLGPGDEVITTPFSFIASANCLLYERVQPVFVDVEPHTLCLDPSRVAAAITSRTRAILGVDVFGHPADWPALTDIARRHGIALIEDACEALGSSLHGRMCGTFGDAAAFAFYPNKQLTTGEGGIIVTEHRRIADVCRSMANQGRRAAGGRWLEHVRLGFNYRLDELSAALGAVQLRRAEAILARRARVAAAYSRLLADIDDIVLPAAAPGAQVSWFVYVVRLTDDWSRTGRDRVLATLREQGVECGDYFRPIHLQPFYRREFGHCRGEFPVAEAAGDRTVALPFHGRMRPGEVKFVVECLRRAVDRVRSARSRR